MPKLNKTLILIGSGSIHTLRYLESMLDYFEKIIFISHEVKKNIIPESVILYDINFRLSNLRAKHQIAQILTQYHSNAVIHIHQANSYAYHALRAIRLAKIKIKTILTTWGSDILVLPNRSLILKNMVKFNLNSVDIVTSDSLYMSSKIRELCPHIKRLYTINFGMKNFPEIIDLSKKENLILSNRLHKKSYNVDKIILAYAKFIQENPSLTSYKLVVAADGEETPNLKNLVHTLKLEDKITFVGMLAYEELTQLLHRTKIFISVPQSDATALSVLEAMGYGCYPILSNLPANLEWVIDQHNGTICQNLEHLDQDILEATELTDKSGKFKQVAIFNHSLIRQKAVFENNIKKFLELYQ